MRLPGIQPKMKQLCASSLSDDLVILDWKSLHHCIVCTDFKIICIFESIGVIMLKYSLIAYVSYII